MPRWEWQYTPTDDGRAGILYLTDGIGPRPIVRIETAGPGHCIDTGRLIASCLNNYERQGEKVGNSKPTD